MPVSCVSWHIISNRSAGCHTDARAAEILEIDMRKALGIRRAEDLAGVVAGGDPDGERRRDEVERGRDDDEPQEILEPAVADDAQQRDGEGGLGPRDGGGGEPRRRVLVLVELLLLPREGVARRDAAAQQGGRDEEDDLCVGVGGQPWRLGVFGCLAPIFACLARLASHMSEDNKRCYILY